jgi:hypothetical protein
MSIFHEAVLQADLRLEVVKCGEGQNDVLSADSDVLFLSRGVGHLLNSEGKRSQQSDHDVVCSLRTEWLDVEEQHIDFLGNPLGNSRDVVLQTHRCSFSLSLSCLTRFCLLPENCPPRSRYHGRRAFAYWWCFLLAGCLGA